MPLLLILITGKFSLSFTSLIEAGPPFFHLDHFLETNLNGIKKNSSVLERCVREALKGEEEPLIIPGKKKTFRPTGKKILQKLQNMKVVTAPDPYSREFPANQKVPVRLLKLAGFEPDIYLNIKGKPKTYKY